MTMNFTPFHTTKDDLHSIFTHLYNSGIQTFTCDNCVTGLGKNGIRNIIVLSVVGAVLLLILLSCTLVIIIFMMKSMRHKG